MTHMNYGLSAALYKKMGDTEFAPIAEDIRLIDAYLLTGRYDHQIVREVIIPEMTASDATKALVLETFGEIYKDDPAPPAQPKNGPDNKSDDDKGGLESAPVEPPTKPKLGGGAAALAIGNGRDGRAL